MANNTARILIMTDSKEELADDIYQYVKFVPDLYEANLPKKIEFRVVNHEEPTLGYFTALQCTDPSITGTGVWVVIRSINATSEEVNKFIHAFINCTDFCEPPASGECEVDICSNAEGFGFKIPMKYEDFDLIFDIDIGTIH